MVKFKKALVCIAKNEDHYIHEWIEYHLKLGFDHIFIYANDWNFTSTDSHVTVKQLHGKNQQWNAYNHFLADNNHNYDWAAFFDVDEFLVLNIHENLDNFLYSYSAFNAIGINWAIFGNNGHTEITNNNYNVLSRFTKRSKENHKTNNHIKTIVKLPSFLYQDIHNVGGSWYNLNKEIRSGPFNEPVDWTVAQINHYLTKSNAECVIKCERGRADMEKKREYSEFLDEFSSNDVEDLKALIFFNNAITR